MSAHEQDITLLEQLKAGSEQAFAVFYARYRRYLMVAAVSLLEDEMEAQDLVQDFFVDFWERQLYFRIDPGFNKGEGEVIKYYIHRIVYNRCLDRLAQRKSRQHRMDGMPAPDLMCQPENRMENLEWQRQLSNALGTAMSKVPPLSAKVFDLAYIQHKSRHEIAAEMGVSPNTVKNQLVRAVKILRSQLKKG
jgi:RNA polymerase sigma-70 factor (ECF subfamily)